MGKQLELFTELESENKGSINIEPSKVIEDCEWCFQFFNNEPVVFAFQTESSEPSPLILKVQPTETDNMIFTQNGMQFKIFARPISEETKLEREKTKENASENKETEA